MLLFAEQCRVDAVNGILIIGIDFNGFGLRRHSRQIRGQQEDRPLAVQNIYFIVFYGFSTHPAGYNKMVPRFRTDLEFQN